LDGARTRLDGDLGQFSLAGAQPKIALTYDETSQRWGVPRGRYPTTHILKPAAGLEDQEINEHFCLKLAHQLELPVADTEIREFESQVAIVVKRFDRVLLPGSTIPRRVHQEDFCQALGLPPGKKFQNDGGPKPEDILKVLRTHSFHPVEDELTFIKALAFNWIIGGTDAHAKNYAILHGTEGAVRLASLFDIISILPYGKIDLNKQKMAMKIGGQYHVGRILYKHWRSFLEVTSNPLKMIESIHQLALDTPNAVEVILSNASQPMASSRIVGQLSDKIIERAKYCAQLMAV